MNRLARLSRAWSRVCVAVTLCAVLACAPESEEAPVARDGARTEAGFRADPEAVAQIQRISREMGQDRGASMAEVRALEAIHRKYPEAAEVRELLHRAYVFRFDDAAAIELIESVPAGQRTQRESKLLAQRLISVGRNEEAAEILEPLLREHPRDPEVYHQLGQVYNGLGRFADTAALLDSIWAHVEETRDAGAYYLRGQAHFRLGETERAIEVLDQCLDIRADHASAHYALARAHSVAGNAEQARMHQERFTELSEASEIALSRKMKLAAMGRATNEAFEAARYEEAERILKEGLELADPGLAVQLHEYLARVYLAMDRPEDALAQRQEAERIRNELRR